MLQDAAREGDIRAIVLRAGDFLDSEGSGDWFDLAMLREAGKGKLAVIGKPGVRHSWAFVPDLARTFEALAQQRARFGAYETFHYAGYFVTPEELAAAIVKAAPVPLKVSHFPWFTLSLFGLVHPMMAAIAKMGYLWQHPMALQDSRLDAILGPDFGTSLDDAVAAMLTRFFPAASEKAA
jgi:nucleoside-diphosphate-sugar epimerase